MDSIPDGYIEVSVADYNTVSICFVLYRCIEEREKWTIVSRGVMLVTRRVMDVNIQVTHFETSDNCYETSDDCYQIVPKCTFD